jgi:hypothetical protein
VLALNKNHVSVTREEAILIIFILPFIIVLRQLFIAEALEMPRPQEKKKE